uniref:Uncharacterized protein n=1 Tax=Cacopsylla melanoneura TaxID=428564 RepID=A0A8D9E7W4_9HEMI
MASSSLFDFLFMMSRRICFLKTSCARDLTCTFRSMMVSVFTGVLSQSIVWLTDRREVRGVAWAIRPRWVIFGVDPITTWVKLVLEVVLGEDSECSNGVLPDPSHGQHMIAPWDDLLVPDDILKGVFSKLCVTEFFSPEAEFRALG